LHACAGCGACATRKTGRTRPGLTDAAEIAAGNVLNFAVGQVTHRIGHFPLASLNDMRRDQSHSSAALQPYNRAVDFDGEKISTFRYYVSQQSRIATASTNRRK
jgi:hypothetical protein